jgi:hypothetical protein
MHHIVTRPRLTSEVVQAAAVAQRDGKSCNWKDHENDAQQPDQRHHIAIKASFG